MESRVSDTFSLERSPRSRLRWLAIALVAATFSWLLYNRLRFKTWDPSAHFAWWYGGLQITSIAMDGQIRFMKDIGGAPFKIGHTPYEDGISVTPFSRIAFRALAPFTKLIGRCGISSYTCAPEPASAVCQILIDGKVVFHSGIVTRGTEAVPFTLELPPTTEFQLVAHEIENPKSCNRVNWVNLELRP